ELERNGWSVTLSSSALRTQEMLATLVQTVGQSHVVVVMASRAAQDSTWLQREVAAALNNGRPVIVVQTGDLPAESWIHATLGTAPSVVLCRVGSVEPIRQVVDPARTAIGCGGSVVTLTFKGGVGRTVLAAYLFAAARLADER